MGIISAIIDPETRVMETMAALGRVFAGQLGHPEDNQYALIGGGAGSAVFLAT